MRTTGPWMIATERDSYGNAMIVDEVGKVVCLLPERLRQRSPDYWDDQSEDNATYIVTACNCHDELLKACKAVIAEGYVHNLNLSEGTLDLINAAIAKAEDYPTYGSLRRSEKPISNKLESRGITMEDLEKG